ncbi:MAG TPA: bifunctional [glutamate--ammonia ligase]-adenylyl-L-tyrosine phosphorylase/[glutamate--ammonia-ligase] adenylyltransferase [Burkholderiaceae bacterium]|nr:bifunctional [glutamate--ammonia ligase]-adenylyl-L-tyrosine phosphorylase/[glutamate--ammonia-ligase] adenylyltransferase [Burkholderiaceae bacterium]
MKDLSFLAGRDWRGARARAGDVPALSHFVERILRSAAGEDAAARSALLAAWAEQGWSAARMALELGDDSGAPPTPERLATDIRRLRQQVIASLVVRDATGACGLPEIVSTTTALAELALRRAVAVHARELAQAHGVPTSAGGVPQDLLVIGMGKLGGAELNVSSDIDLIFVYDEDGETRAMPGADDVRPLSNHEFFTRLGRRVIPAISDVTGDGYVFRVDMRLRPNGDAGPLAVSTAMLEEYLMVQGREWERFAWLKGRVVSAPVFASADEFERQERSLAGVVRPFVFRKYLDFGAINALRDLHGLIRAESSRRNAGREERSDNVKLGRGGIREIEFIAQAFQIIRGGRDPGLRSRSTLETLATLGRQGVLPEATCDRLAASYVFLRNLEHALQYVDDAQTHVLPVDAAARERVAKLLGATDAGAMLAEYRAVQECVAGVFDAVFAEPTETARQAPMPTTWNAPGDGDENALVEHLQDQGFRDPPGTAQRLRGVLSGRRVQGASAAARAGIERLLQRALASAIELSHGTGAAHDIGPDEHFARFAQFAEVIAGRNTYVTLLNQYPHAFERVIRMLAASRWAAEYLVLHPILLDELLDERLHEREPDWAAWSAAVRRQLDEADGDQERQMNLLRDVHHAQVFRLLVADLDGRLSVERLADHLSALADYTLGLTLERVWRTIAKRHREVPRFAVIGYGKLGGKELGYVSDLDLIFLFDDEHPDAPEIYSVLARRLVTWLTAQTSSGNLFDIDLRLRPNGNAGLMVSSFDAFSRYQRNEDGLGAWVWEHQALTRARYCAGDAELGYRFEAERVHVMTQVRDLAHLKSEVLKMRQKMLDGHPNPSALFDLKHDRGGMVDIEFIVQCIVLAHSHRHGDLVRNLGNIALLQMAGGMRLIDMALAREVADAYRTFRALQHRMRLNGAERARVEPAEVEAPAAAVRRLWREVFGTD